MARQIHEFLDRHRKALARQVAGKLTPALGEDRAGEEAARLLDRLLEAADPPGVAEAALSAARRWRALRVPAEAITRALASLIESPPSAEQATSTGLGDMVRRLMDSVQTPLLLVDRQRRVRICNLAGAALLGAGPEVVEGMEFRDLFAPELREPIERLMRHEGTDGSIQLARVRLAERPESELLVTRVEFFEAGELAGWFLTLSPNATEVLADASLSEMLRHEMSQKEKFAALLTVSHAVVNTLDLNVILTTIAHQVRNVIHTDECTVFLYDPEEQFLKPVVCDVEAYYEEMMACRLRLGEGITGAVALTGKGEVVNDAESDPRAVSVPNTPEERSSLMCVPLFEREKVAGVITMVRMGDRHFVDEDLELATLFAGQCSAAIANARLFEGMKSAYEELRQTQAQLVQSAKLNALGEMAGGVAHDFNNILAAILGRTQLLLQNVDDRELRSQLQVIEQAALDGAQTVRRVQEFTRVRQDERFESLDVNHVVQGVIELTRTAWEAGAKRRGVTIEVDLDLRAEHRIAGNASELREVFTNLVLNAVDAMPWGGHLSVRSESDGSDVRVWLSDDGVGMDRETCEKVFDPFFTTKQVKGTGLGLSVAYGIVTRHRGSIEVHSTPGRGTEFLMRFPVGRAVEALPVPTAQGPLPRLRVLVVDDEEPVLSVMADLLRSLKQEVSVALGGAAGLKMFDEGSYDVVFSDLGMPEVNGWDLAHGVKARRPETPVVLVTGWGYQLEGAAAQAHGVDRVLPKPFSIGDVDGALRAIGEQLALRRRAA